MFVSVECSNKKIYGGENYFVYNIYENMKN